MIATEKKDRKEILEALKGIKTVFIFGCGDCATLARTGGEEEVEQIKEFLDSNGFKVTGSIVPDTSCDERLLKMAINENREKIERSDAILILSCGAGANALSDLIEKPIFIGLNTKFLGTTERIGIFHEYCSMCGDCVLNETLGICPVTRCPKGLVNGPCGGAINGKCETDSEMDCIWIVIYNRLKSMKRLRFTTLGNLKKLSRMGNISKTLKPQTIGSDK